MVSLEGHALHHGIRIDLLQEVAPDSLHGQGGLLRKPDQGQGARPHLGFTPPGIGILQ